MKLLLLTATALAVGLGGAMTVASRSSPADFRGSEPPGDIRLPRFALPNWDGTRVDSRTLFGKVVLVTFLETKCHAECPLIADRIDLALAQLDPAERRDVYAAAISTHPRDDTRASARKFLRNHGVLGELDYLVADERRLRPVWRAFRVFPALDSGDAELHSAPVRIFDRNGRWVSTLHAGADLTPANLVHDVRVALRSS